MSSVSAVFGPTLEEMRNPKLLPHHIADQAQKARHDDPLNEINLYNITWHLEDGTIPHLVLPRQLTGTRAHVVVMSGRHFPTGSHKVGPAYSIVREHQMAGHIAPGQGRLVFPSTGNFGIGGAWVGPRMHYESLIVLPEEMSAERFEKIHGYGADIIATHGCESNVKEIYDKVNELRLDPTNKILNQFEEFANYRFHYHVTGHAILDLLASLQARGIGNGQPAAFISAMGSAGTIAAGDLLKQHHSACAIVGLEPIQCPTLYNVGYGGHRIEGIGDKHVTWLHHVTNMDLMMCIDDRDTLRGMQLLQDGAEHLAQGLDVDELDALGMNGVFGPSGVCNVLGAIKTAHFLNLTEQDVVVTVATDGYDRYPSVSARLDAEEGPMTREEAWRRFEIFLNARPDYVLEGTREVRRRWHNQKYFTWVEQQGKSIAELDRLLDEDFWVEQQVCIPALDGQWKELRGW